MKILIIIFLTFFTLYSNEINWVKSYKEALKKSKHTNKPIYLLVTSPTCKWCKKLEATTLQEDDVINEVNKYFIAVHLTRDKDYYPTKIKTNMIPTSAFLTPKQRIIYSVPGFWISEDYVAILSDVIHKYKKL